jgi:hypothetical protein
LFLFVSLFELFSLRRGCGRRAWASAWAVFFAAAPSVWRLLVVGVVAVDEVNESGDDAFVDQLGV